MRTQSTLADLADWYYHACDLGEEGDETAPEDYWRSADGIQDVLTRAFASSDCGDFAVILHEMTGYPVINLMGADGLPIHSFVRTPDGQAMDVLGSHSDLEVAKRYGFGGNKPRMVEVTPDLACGHLPSDEWTSDGYDERAQRLAAVIRQLPWAPFNTPEFQAISCRPLAGIDFPADGNLTTGTEPTKKARTKSGPG